MLDDLSISNPRAIHLSTLHSSHLESVSTPRAGASSPFNVQDGDEHTPKPDLAHGRPAPWQAERHGP